eukprot:2471340-Alexandrium_andersonii.AAC.1
MGANMLWVVVLVLICMCITANNSVWWCHKLPSWPIVFATTACLQVSANLQCDVPCCLPGVMLLRRGAGGRGQTDTHTRHTHTVGQGHRHAEAAAAKRW